MIDWHSHILPQMDDGSQSVEESLNMLKVLYMDVADMEPRIIQLEKGDILGIQELLRGSFDVMYPETYGMNGVFAKHIFYVNDCFLDGSFERVRVISSLNDAFKEYYLSGELQRYCKVSISVGNDKFRHEMSSFFLRSGFKISIQNDNGLGDAEMREISQYILGNLSFVKRLMALGFDTLIIYGATTNKSCTYALKEYANLNNFFLM